MKEKWEIPNLNNRVVCIADIDNPELASQISSLYSREGLYFPLYMFPEVNTIRGEDVKEESDEFLSNMIGEETAVFINNSIAKMTGAETYIFAGLNASQKSYMSAYIKNYIEVSDVEELEEKLGQVADFTVDTLECRSDELLKGLYLASKNGQRLIINEDSESLATPLVGSEGVIGVEESSRGHISSLIGVNYAVSLGADLIILEPVTREEADTAETRLQRWKDEDNHNHFQKVYSKAKNRLSGYDLSAYKYATFFTTGIPYGLGIDNIIPTTHVHLNLRPDLFVINGIGTETGGKFHSAVVFSPQFFADEETESVTDTLQGKNYFVRELIGEDATTRNLDFHAQHFPYDMLHICSHGGEMEGYEITLNFKDRKGTGHTLIYDEAVSFSPVEGKELIAVLQKAFFRKLNGYKWMSSQLKEQNYPDYVYKDMFKSVRDDKTPRQKKVGKIPSAYAIVTHDGFNQGAFKILSSHHNPIIFNNSCWSWGQISTFFIVSGARGYIGTLWPIGNEAAVVSAKKLYSMINDYSLMSCLYAAQKEISKTPSANIFHYWGLHFTSIAENGVSEEESRVRVFAELLRSIFKWIEKVNTTKSQTIKKNSAQVVNELHAELIHNFTHEDLKNLEKEFDKMPEVDTDVEVIDESEVRTIETRVLLNKNK